MNKTVVMSSIVAACLSTSGMAANFYIGPTVSVQHISGANSSFNGFFPKMTLGYGGLMSNDYYLAGEIFVIPFTGTFSSSQVHGASSIRTTRGFGISFLPGMKLNEQMLVYLRLGLINTKFQSPNESRTGGQAGIGFQTPMSARWDLRFEYTYTAYRSVANLGSPKSNELGIGVLYKFDAS